MKLLLLLLLIASCGRQKVTGIPARIDIVHSIDLENLEQGFINECEKEFETQEEIDVCVDNKLEDVLSLLDGILNPKTGKSK